MEEIALQADIPAEASFVGLRDFIFWSTMIGLFGGWARIQVPFWLRLFDAIMLVNLVLMTLIVNLARVPRWILFFLMYLALSGGAGVALGTDSMSQVAKEFLGISISLLYFYYFFRMIENDYERAFLAYARVAYWFAVVALPIWVARCLYLGRYERLHGLLSEPAWFCELILPAVYWYAYTFFRSRKHGKELGIMLLTIILSSSSLGYLGVALGAMLMLSGRKRNLIAIPVVAGGLLVLAYTSSGFFRERADDMLLAITTQDVSGTDFSTYAWISNVFVTLQVLKGSPLIGNGLGSHVISHARYLDDMPGVEIFIEAGARELNATEAASLALRTLSELGVIGLAGILIFIFYFRVGGTSKRAAISSAIIVNFVFKLGRDGTYFPAEQFFFVLIYILNYRQQKLEGEPGIRRLPRKASL